MDQPKYRIEIFWSDEDGGYIANVPDLRYCSAFGVTYEEALREVLVAMELHLDTLREEGRPIPEPTSRRVVGVQADVSDSGSTIQIVEEIAVSSTEDVGESIGQLADSYSELAQVAIDLAGTATEDAGEGTVSATEAARRKAEEVGVDLSEIEGTGSGGLITVKDVVRALDRQ
jgi:predicted RNase H-like HicB family nuclease